MSDWWLAIAGGSIVGWLLLELWARQEVRRLEAAVAAQQAMEPPATAHAPLVTLTLWGGPLDGMTQAFPAPTAETERIGLVLLATVPSDGGNEVLEMCVYEAEVIHAPEPLVVGGNAVYKGRVQP
jgi:hypothetical protein